MNARLKTLLLGHWSWHRPITSLVAIYVLLAVFALSCADRLIFLPPPSSYGADTPHLVFFENENAEEIAAFHFPASPGQATILYSHGNASDIGHLRPLFREWHQSGLGVLAYDYPGYGLTKGRPSEASVYQSARAAWDFLTKNQNIPAGEIVIVGNSVGSGPACYLAEMFDARALVLVSPLTSTYAVKIPPWLLPGDRFQNLKRIPAIREPTLVIHGEKDAIIPATHGKKLFEASPAKIKRWHPVPDAGHNDLLVVAPDLPTLIAQFARNPSS